VADRVSPSLAVSRRLSRKESFDEEEDFQAPGPEQGNLEASGGPVRELAPGSGRRNRVYLELQLQLQRWERNKNLLPLVHRQPEFV
ncbi:MAG TPA: hypothetical protein VLX28_08095, partial [Thermoanaerobaculia bacterium]|nr:hypothetical protein [Thermoanaerobaculia bacterium]